jgi:hypothetical protein
VAVVAAADAPTPKPEGRVLDELLLDRIDALRVLRADTPEEKARLLENIGGAGKAEQDIVNELSKMKPLWRPDRFEEAHRLAMRSIEVLDRNGARNATLHRLGPLRPVGEKLVQLITQWIVRNHQNTIVTRIRKLYERREAASDWSSPEHRMLTRARIDISEVEKGFKASAIGIPAFLLGGAFLTTILSGLQRVFKAAVGSQFGTIILGVVVAVVLAAVAWAALVGASVARRRIRLSTDQPLSALWETIGACGKPPRDESYDFAVYAIVLTVLAWIVVPIVIWFILTRVVNDVSVVVDKSPSTTTAMGAAVQRVLATISR